MKIVTDRIHRAVQFKLETPETRAAAGAEALNKGTCGRLTGIALVYDQPDDYGSMFARGCLDKTRAERVQPGKVKLFADHGPFTETHVGTVRSMTDIGDGVVMVADLFDTEAGKRMKEYLEAVLGSGSETGLSIGFRPVKHEWRAVDGEKGVKDNMLVFEEISLREVSITPVPAVPGTEVTGVRREPGETDKDLLLRTLSRILGEIPEAEARAAVDAAYASSAATTDTPAAPPPAVEAASESTADAVSAEGSSGTPDADEATMDERMELLRSSMA